jgi:isocitrate dehydrogenase
LTEDEIITKKMYQLLAAMDGIQHGMIEGCIPCTKKSAVELREVLDSYHREAPVWIVKKSQIYVHEFAKKSLTNMKVNTDNIFAAIQTGRIDHVYKNYTLLLKECMSCHIRVRNW